MRNGCAIYFFAAALNNIGDASFSVVRQMVSGIANCCTLIIFADRRSVIDIAAFGSYRAFYAFAVVAAFSVGAMFIADAVDALVCIAAFFAVGAMFIVGALNANAV